TLFVMVVDGVAEVGWRLPVTVVVQFTFEDVFIAKTGPSIGSKIKGSVIRMDVGRTFIVSGIDRRAQVGGCSPLAVPLKLRFPDVVPSLSAASVTYEIKRTSICRQ